MVNTCAQLPCQLCQDRFPSDPAPMEISDEEPPTGGEPPEGENQVKDNVEAPAEKQVEDPIGAPAENHVQDPVGAPAETEERVDDFILLVATGAAPTEVPLAEPSTLSMDQDRGCGSEDLLALARLKSQVFQPMEFPDSQMLEQSIVDDNKLPLDPASSPGVSGKIAALEEELKNMRAKQLALRSKREAAFVTNEVVQVDDSLPYGKDTGDTLEMDEGAVQNLMDRFNTAVDSLELLQECSEPAAAWHQ